MFPAGHLPASSQLDSEWIIFTKLNSGSSFFFHLRLKFGFAPQILKGGRSGGSTTAMHLLDQPCGVLTGARVADGARPRFGLGPLFSWQLIGCREAIGISSLCCSLSHDWRRKLRRRERCPCGCVYVCVCACVTACLYVTVIIFKWLF